MNDLHIMMYFPTRFSGKKWSPEELGEFLRIGISFCEFEIVFEVIQELYARNSKDILHHGLKYGLFDLFITEEFELDDMFRLWLGYLCGLLGITEEDYELVSVGNALLTIDKQDDSRDWLVRYIMTDMPDDD